MTNEIATETNSSQRMEPQSLPHLTDTDKGMANEQTSANRLEAKDTSINKMATEANSAERMDPRSLPQLADTEKGMANEQTSAKRLEAKDSSTK